MKFSKKLLTFTITSTALLGTALYLAIPQSLISQSLAAASGHAKTVDQYWSEVDLQPDTLEQLLSPTSCQSSERQFLACANAVLSVSQKYGATVTLTGEVIAGVEVKNRQVFAEKELLAPWQKLIASRPTLPLFPFLEVWKNLRTKFVPEDQQSYAVGMGINGFLSVAEDPHTYILPSDYYTEVVSKATHKSVSIGVVLGRNDQNYFIKKVVAQSSAEVAGLKKGDVILELNGKNANRMTPYEISDQLKGETGSTLNFKLARGAKILKMSVLRSERNLETVGARVLEGIKPFGVLTINKFATGTCTSTKAALESLRSQGIAGLLLDLRDNPGGQMGEAACVSGLFLGPGKKVFEIHLLGESEADEEVYTDQAQMYDGPIAVLVNSGSASAAEILAGVIKDHSRGLLVGERTFGKGSFQEGRVWPENHKMVIFQTKGFYFLPSGMTPQLVGLEPDVKVSFKDKFALREFEQYAFPLHPLGVPFKKLTIARENIDPNLLSCFSYESEFIAPGDPEIQEAHRILNCGGIAGRGE